MRRVVDVVQAVREARKSSEIMRGLEHARSIGSKGVRLTTGQISELESRGNTAADWSRVTVSPEFRTEFVRDSHLQGDVYLGAFGPPVPVAHGVKLPSGVYGVRVADAAIDDGALVQDTRLVVRTVVGREAVVIGIGEIIGHPSSRFGLGIAVRVGVETGGREVALYPEISIPVAARVASDREDARMLKLYSDAVRAYTDALVSDVTIIGAGVHAFHSPYIRASFIGDRALVDGAMGIEGSVVLSSEREPTEVSSGSYVRRSVIQWGCRVTSSAHIDESALLERSSAGKHCNITSSIIGPCSVVEKGEVSSSLLGPLTSMHHQSLLISAVWPGGRGNIGAGALVGSNHTSRSADQEIRPCEGAFIGLGTRVKFPADFEEAPYSVFASGIDIGSQRMAMPFSLVRAAAHKLLHLIEDPKPDTNEIIPAWVLSDSAYTLARNQRKFSQRCRAQRQTVNPDLLRPEILELCRKARDKLRALPDRDIYTKADLPELGGNVMTRATRDRSIDGYTAGLVGRALLGIWERARDADDLATALRPEERDPCDIDDDAERHRVTAWRIHRSILTAERPGVSLRDLLTELLQSRETFVTDVIESKEKDDVRGEATISGYMAAHARAVDDRVVIDLKEDVGHLSTDVTAFLEKLDGDGPGLDDA
jgi:hypothetical protein